MDYKTILVALDDDPARAARLEAALALCRHFGAGLVGLTATGTRLEPFRGAGEEAGKYAARAAADLQRTIDENLATLQAAVASPDATLACRHVVVEAETGWALATEGRFADLILPPPLQAGDNAPALMAEEAEYALLNAGRPVLLVPAGAKLAPQAHVLVGWDGSQPAARAVSDALPLLAKASAVTVVVVAGDSGEDEQQAGGERLLQWLAAHGVTAWLRVQRGGQPGEVLLRLTQELNAGLLVAGGYGRSRLRERMLGGTTRTLVRQAGVPLLLSH
ncbi:universal stress protein [Cupriavidus sp. WKF15]|uniref:universal stress protein n=1 Tax=Cupriavidus sp. WKF15 TaxID=3032282 RepID=UPI0023E224B9|nr:universal stress protein [Cupriavidus sp. WKF15]WER49088.1 universal stress protein [Cupriavidus sp. WKF15]